MKRHNVATLRKNLLESMVNRTNILSLLEASQFEPYNIGKWKGYTITLPDGVELKTKSGIKMAGAGLPVKVFNKDGQYTAFRVDDDGVEHEIELVYVLNECDNRSETLVVFD